MERTPTIQQLIDLNRQDILDLLRDGAEIPYTARLTMPEIGYLEAIADMEKQARIQQSAANEGQPQDVAAISSQQQQYREWINNPLADTVGAFSLGAGSIYGFLLAGNLLGSNPFTKAIASGGLESLSEAGGFLADAYRNGQDNDKALANSFFNFGTNAVVNIGLDWLLAPFGILNTSLKDVNSIKRPFLRNMASRIQSIKNPYLRKIVTSGLETGQEILNETFQEPSQRLIEEASMNSLNNGTG